MAGTPTVGRTELKNLWVLPMIDRSLYAILQLNRIKRLGAIVE